MVAVGRHRGSESMPKAECYHCGRLMTTFGLIFCILLHND